MLLVTEMTHEEEEGAGYLRAFLLGETMKSPNDTFNFDGVDDEAARRGAGNDTLS